MVTCRPNKVEAIVNLAKTTEDAVRCDAYEWLLQSSACTVKVHERLAYDMKVKHGMNPHKLD